MVWGKAGSTTLGSSSMTIDSGTITSSKCNQILNHTLATSNIENSIRLGNSSIDSGNNYAHRRANNGGSDSLTVNTNRIQTGKTDPVDQFDVVYAVNIATEEKLAISHNCTRMTAGNNAPERVESVGKWTNTSSQFDKVQSYEGGGVANFLSGSNLTVLGSEITPVAAITFAPNAQVGSRAEITDTRKIYYRDDISFKELGTLPVNYRKDTWYEQLTGETP